MWSILFRKKTIGVAHQQSPLKRTLSSFDLTLMGIGAIIGAGVFVVTGIAAATKAGPAVVISYAIAGFTCLFAALSYAELASSVGGSGSAYSYSYAGFGELIAWFIGWNLILEYFMACAAVAVGWSGYVENLFQALGIYLPIDLTKNIFEGGFIDLLAVMIVLAITTVLCIGVKSSARFNAVVVCIKLITIAIFIGIAFFNINPLNYQNFLPFGWEGVAQGAALVFFAFIGLDAVATTVDEAKDPQRSVPIGIIASLIICTFIYILVSAGLTGIVPYGTLNVKSPVAQALLSIGYKSGAGIVAVGAIAGLTTVILVMFYGLTRILLAMCTDGLLPRSISKINEQTKTPTRLIVIVGILMALVAGFTPMGRAAELVNIGTLTAFVFVCVGLLVLRVTHPKLQRPFKAPYSPFVPLLGAISCLYLMFNLAAFTWWRFLIWTIIGLIIYFAYGMRHSVLGQASQK